MRRERVDLPSIVRRIPRSVAATLTVALVAHQTGRIFATDAHVWATVAAVVAVGAVAMVLAGLVWPARVAVACGAGLAAAAIGVISVGGELPGDLADAPTRGIADLLASVWPSPTLAAGVGAVAGLAAVAAWSAVELVLRRSAPSALLPSLALAGVVALLSAEAGAPPLWWVVAYVVVALAALLPDRAASRSGVALVHAAIMTVIAVLATLLFGSAIADERFDPRGRVDAPAMPETGLSPLARLDEWRSRTPATEVFRTSLASARRWRLVGLTRYDGRTWLPADDYRQSSATVGAVDDDQALVPVDVRIGELDAAWLPMVDRTVEATLADDGEGSGTGAALRIDGTRSGLLPDVTPEVGTTYQLVVQPLDVQPGVLAAVRAAEADEVLVGDFELSPEVLELATTIVAGARTDYERAEAIARYLREQYVLDFDSPPGHSVAVIELFLERSRRGRDEQFVAAYGLLAHAVGLPVRIAVGFQSTPIAEGSGTVATSDQAIAWPEIDFGELGWVPFDPVPAQSDTAPPSQGGGAVAPIGEEADTPPTTAASTASSAPEAVTPDTVADESRTAVASTAVGAGVSLVIATAVLLGYVGCVLALKSLRRRRRRRAATTGAQALGAFRSGVDVLVDLGVRAQHSRTDHELVAAGSQAIGEPATRLAAAATVATQAVYSPHEPSPEECELAWAAIEDFEKATATGVGRLRYLRSKVSTRSLRRGLPD